MHGYRYPEHERQLGELARRIGFITRPVSHEVSPLDEARCRVAIRPLSMLILSPVLRRYVEQVASQLPGVRLQFMQSSGGLTDAHQFQGKDAILSGPAGGIVGAVRAAGEAGFEKIIGFDMGGTSTDVAHYAGEYERAFDTEVAGVRLRAPIMQIHTVAAGGGSICRFDGVRLRVGPQSAGADPGPAAYRRGGPLTVTDANVLLGRIQPEFFPAVFGAGGDQSLDAAMVKTEVRGVGGAGAASGATSHTEESIAAGCIRVAVENMANAIKKISVQRGHDVTEYTLVCFGGAAGQHACLVADALRHADGLHPSASGRVVGVRHRACGCDGDETAGGRGRACAMTRLPTCSAAFATLESAARETLLAQGVPLERIRVERKLAIKYAGTDSTLQLSPDPGTVQASQLAGALLSMNIGSAMAFLMIRARARSIESISVEAIGASHESRVASDQAQRRRRRRCRRPSTRGRCTSRPPGMPRHSLNAATLHAGREADRSGGDPRTQHHHRDRAGLASGR